MSVHAVDIHTGTINSFFFVCFMFKLWSKLLMIVFCSKRSKIASNRLLAVPRKVFTGKPIITHKKKRRLNNR